MVTPLLQTKHYIPSVRAELVLRPRLIDRLNAGLPRKLTLISAPAGFGKTTLVSRWINQLTQKEKNSTQIAWVSLDENDNDLTRFLVYFITALQTLEANIGKGALSALQSPQPPPTEVVLTTLLNDISADIKPIVFVLDDYHLIDAKPVHDALSFLIKHLPPQMHILITTREDPPLHLARLRARDQLTELRAGDLRFTPSEISQFLNQVMGLDLSTEDITALEVRTEGWIAGLQLAAIALQGTISMQGRNEMSGFIRAFTGSHHFVLDYLAEEVFDQQSENIQTFLLQTSILEQLSGSLCDAVRFGNDKLEKDSSEDIQPLYDDGQTVLEKLEHSNLFIIPLDEKRRWYRYHHLLTDLLRHRLQQTQPELVLTLHIRASIWYEKNGHTDKAIEHALHAEDYKRVTFLLEKNIDALWQHSEHFKLSRWLFKLPVDLVHSKPNLSIFHALYMFTSGQIGAASQSLQALGQMPASTAPDQQTDLPNDDRVKIKGRLAAVRAFMVSYAQQDVSKIIQYAGQALEYLPEQDSVWRCIAAIALGDAFSFKGEMVPTYKAYLEALAAIKSTGNNYFLIVVNLKLANTLKQQGRLQQTIEICRQQKQLADETGLSQMGVVGCLLTVWGEALAELNDLDTAVELSKKGLDMTAPGGDIAMLGWSYLCLIRVLFSNGDIAGVEEIIRKIGQIDQKSNLPPWVTNQTAIWQIRIWLAQDRIEATVNWVEARGLDINEVSKPLHELDYFRLNEYVLFTRILLMQGHLDKTKGLLQWLLKAAKAGDRVAKTIEILLLQALTFQADNNIDQALAALKNALVIAEPGGFIRIFVDEGLSMARLLYEALSQNIAPDYIRKLLAVFPDIQSEQTEVTQDQNSQSELLEPLSVRELEVLQLIADGLTNQEIASQLFLSLNTVKAHLRNIYGKFDTHNRTQTIAEARRFGLI